MARWTLPATLAAVLVFGVMLSVWNDAAAERKPAQVLRHVVLFKFKDGVSASDIRKVETAFCALPSKIDLMKSFEWGTDVSPEKLSDGFTHCFFSTFHSAADRDAYLIHPEHKAFGALLGPYLDKVTVVDYWTKE